MLIYPGTTTNVTYIFVHLYFISPSFFFYSYYYYYFGRGKSSISQNDLMLNEIRPVPPLSRLSSLVDRIA